MGHVGHRPRLPGPVCHKPQTRVSWSLFVLDGEAQLFEHRDGAGLAALEITGPKALAGGELVGRAQDGLGG